MAANPPAILVRKASKWTYDKRRYRCSHSLCWTALGKLMNLPVRLLTQKLQSLSACFKTTKIAKDGTVAKE